MRFLICLVVQLMLPQVLKAETAKPFVSRIYTPKQVIDTQNKGAKGAVQLLWQNKGEGVRYEIQIDNGSGLYTAVTENHFFHTMLYFNKNYRWRVRSLSSRKETGFSQWIPVRVLSRHKDHQDDFLGDKTSGDLQELAFDQGG